MEKTCTASYYKASLASYRVGKAGSWIEVLERIIDSSARPRLTFPAQPIINGQIAGGAPLVFNEQAFISMSKFTFGLIT